MVPISTCDIESFNKPNKTDTSVRQLTIVYIVDSLLRPRAVAARGVAQCQKQ